MNLTDTVFHTNSVSGLPGIYVSNSGGGGAILADSCGVVSVSGNSEFVGNFVKELYIDMMGVGGALSLYVSQVVVEGPVEHPIPSTPNPKPHTLKPKPQTLEPYNSEPNS